MGRPNPSPVWVKSLVSMWLDPRNPAPTHNQVRWRAVWWETRRSGAAGGDRTHDPWLRRVGLFIGLWCQSVWISNGSVGELWSVWVGSGKHPDQLNNTSCYPVSDSSTFTNFLDNNFKSKKTMYAPVMSPMNETKKPSKKFWLTPFK
jgi:hypothetical protein